MPAKAAKQTLQGRRVRALQDDLYKEYIKADFQRRLFDSYSAAGTDLVEMATARQKASLEVQFRVIPKYGFEATRTGAFQCQMAVDYGTGDDLGIRGEYLVFLCTQERQEVVGRRFLPHAAFASIVGSPLHIDLLKWCKPASPAKRLQFEPQSQLLDALVETYENKEVQDKLYKTAQQVMGQPPEVAAHVRQEICAAIEGPVVEAFGFPNSKAGVLEAWYRFCNTTGGLGNFGSRGEWKYMSDHSTPRVHYILYLIDAVFHRSEIQVAAEDGTCCKVVVDLANDVKALKEQIQQETGILELEQQLTLGSREIHNSTMLSALVPLGSTVEVALSRRRSEVVSWLNRLRQDSVARRPALSMQEMPEELRNDAEFMLPAVQEHAQALKFAAPVMRADKETVLAAVGHAGQAIRFAAEELQDDVEVVFRAVGQKGMALEYVSDRMQADRDVVLAAVQQDGSALEFAAAELRADREVVLAAVRGDGFAILLGAEELRADIDVASAAARQDWKVLRHFPPELCASRKVVTAAVSENGAALQFAAPELQASRELVKTALETCGEALHYAAGALRSDQELAMAAVLQDGLALRCVPPEAQNLEIALAAVRENKLAMQHVAERLRAALAEARGEQRLPQRPLLSGVVVLDEPRQKLKRHFQTLGLSETAPEEQVKRQYRQLALQHHPDKHPDDPEGAKRRFQLINSAYQAIKEVLSI